MVCWVELFIRVNSSWCMSIYFQIKWTQTHTKIIVPKARITQFVPVGLSTDSTCILSSREPELAWRLQKARFIQSGQVVFTAGSTRRLCNLKWLHKISYLLKHFIRIWTLANLLKPQTIRVTGLSAGAGESSRTQLTTWVGRGLRV